MKATLLSSVVALVAGQPNYFQLPPPPIRGACTTHGDPHAECCVDPVGPWAGGCDMLANRYPGSQSETCCAGGTTCCPTEFFNPNDSNLLSWTPKFSCCDDATQQCNLDTTTGIGVCEDLAPGDTATDPMNPWTEHLDGEGRCASDGALPLKRNAVEVFQCSTNVLIPFNTFQCPGDSVCAHGRAPNANMGVCCLSSGCNLHTTCESCVTPRTQEEEDAMTDAEKKAQPQRVCSWLTQGDHYHAGPRCVQSCRQFPEKSCIVGGVSPAAVSMCPASATNENGTNYNTGTCQRRCGQVGTGRSSRINNNNNVPPPAPIGHPTTECCMKNPGDFCCDPWMGLAMHCVQGYVVGGPQCGVPKRGSPNTFFNTPPYAPPPYQGPEWGAFPSFQPPPPPMMGPYPGPPPMPYGPYGGFGFVGPTPYGGGMYGGFVAGGMYGGGGFPIAVGGVGMYGWRETTKAAQSELKAMWIPTPYMGFPPPPPPPPMGYPYYGPGPLPEPSDQYPSDYICSCDDLCSTLYDDCCSDYDTQCVASSTTTTAAP